MSQGFKGRTFKSAIRTHPCYQLYNIPDDCAGATNVSTEGDGWDNDDEEAFESLEDEQEREIQERMKRLNTRTNQKARPPRQPPSREGGLERQNSLDSEASLASTQSFASNVTSGKAQLCPADMP